MIIITFLFVMVCSYQVRFNEIVNHLWDEMAVKAAILLSLVLENFTSVRFL